MPRMTWFSTNTSKSVDKVVKFVIDLNFSGVELNNLTVVRGKDSEDLT